MTSKQRKIYDIILSFYTKHNYSPSVSTLAIQFDMTHQGMTNHIHALAEKGMVRLPARGVIIPVAIPTPTVV